MNKLTALYGVMRQMKTMKEKEVVKASFKGSVLLDQGVIAEGAMAVSKENGKLDRKVSLNLLEEIITFEHIGHKLRENQANGECGCDHRHGHRHGYGHMHGHMDMHGQEFHMAKGMHRGHRHGGGLNKAMHFIKLLDLMTYEELTEERSVLSLKVTPSDFPEEVCGKMAGHLNYKKHMMHGCGTSEQEKYGEWFKASGLSELEAESFELVSIDMKLVIDKNSNPIEFEAEHVCSAKTQGGTLKPIHFKMSGKLL